MFFWTVYLSKNPEIQKKVILFPQNIKQLNCFQMKNYKYVLSSKSAY